MTPTWKSKRKVTNLFKFWNTKSNRKSTKLKSFSPPSSSKTTSFPAKLSRPSFTSTVSEKPKSQLPTQKQVFLRPAKTNHSTKVKIRPISWTPASQVSILKEWSATPDQTNPAFFQVWTRTQWLPSASQVLNPASVGWPVLIDRKIWKRLKSKRKWRTLRWFWGIFLKKMKEKCLISQIVDSMTPNCLKFWRKCQWWRRKWRAWSWRKINLRTMEFQKQFRTYQTRPTWTSPKTTWPKTFWVILWRRRRNWWTWRLSTCGTTRWTKGRPSPGWRNSRRGEL